jgi:hypothetical protein
MASASAGLTAGKNFKSPNQKKIPPRLRRNTTTLEEAIQWVRRAGAWCPRDATRSAQSRRGGAGWRRREAIGAIALFRMPFYVL